MPGRQVTVTGKTVDVPEHIESQPGGNVPADDNPRFRLLDKTLDVYIWIPGHQKVSVQDIVYNPGETVCRP
jgi:hypothetical protein